MANFLDKTGLSHFWDKIVAKINSKKVNQVETLSKNLETNAISRLKTGNINTTTDTIGTLQTFQATATMKATADGSYPDQDSNVMMMNWDSTAGYSTQLAQRNITGEIKVRGQNKKTWTAWRTVLDSTNKDDYLTDYAKSEDIPDISNLASKDEITYSLGALNGVALGSAIASTLTKSGMVGTGTFYNVTDITFPFSGSNGTRAFIAYRAVSYLRVDAYAFANNETFTAYYFVNDNTWSTPVRYTTTEDLSTYYTKTEDDNLLNAKVNKSGDTLSGQLVLERSANGDTYFKTTRTDKGSSIGFGIGSAGTNRGIYDFTLNKWIYHTNGTTVFANANINIGQVQEWGNASFTYSDGFAAYNTTANNTQEPRACKWGRVVNLTGAFKTTVARESTASVVIGKVPSGCEPLHDVRLRQQGSGQNSYLLVISTNGNMSAERYGVASNIVIPNNAWLNINATYISKS